MATKTVSKDSKAMAKQAVDEAQLRQEAITEYAAFIDSAKAFVREMFDTRAELTPAEVFQVLDRVSLSQPSASSGMYQKLADRICAAKVVAERIFCESSPPTVFGIHDRLFDDRGKPIHDGEPNITVAYGLTVEIGLPVEDVFAVYDACFDKQGYPIQGAREMIRRAAEVARDIAVVEKTDFDAVLLVFERVADVDAEGAIVERAGAVDDLREAGRIAKDKFASFVVTAVVDLHDRIFGFVPWMEE